MKGMDLANISLQYSENLRLFIFISYLEIEEMRVQSYFHLITE